jgi:hypothetical protein
MAAEIDMAARTPLMAPDTQAAAMSVVDLQAAATWAAVDLPAAATWAAVVVDSTVVADPTVVVVTAESF